MIIALNWSGSYNVCKTAILIFASDEESKAEISESDVDFPLFDGGNEKKVETTRPRQSQLCMRHAVNSLNTTLMEV